MKANELMIGDWVLTLDSTHKEKVFAQTDAIEEGQHSILVTRECSNWFVDIDWIEPISLTPEILEKNGFKEYDGLYRLDIAEGIFVNADFKSKEPFVSVHNTCYYATPICKYVHQLQHALRLCGIDPKITL